MSPTDKLIPGDIIDALFDIRRLRSDILYFGFCGCLRGRKPGQLLFRHSGAGLGTDTTSGQTGAGESGVYGTSSFGAYLADFTLTFANAVFSSNQYDLTGNLNAGVSRNSGGAWVSGVFGLISATGTPLLTAFDKGSPQFLDVLDEFTGSSFSVSFSPCDIPVSMANPPVYLEAYGYSFSADWTLKIELAEEASRRSRVCRYRQQACS